MLLGMGGVKAQETEIEYLPGDPISLESIVSEGKLVSIAANISIAPITDMPILYGNNKDNQIYCHAINHAISEAGTDGSYRFRITKATDEGLVKPTGVTTLYRIQAFKSDGTSIYTGPWYGGNCYLNDISWTRNLVPLGDEGDPKNPNDGEQGCFFGITPIAEKENTYKITSYKKDGSIVAENIYGKKEWVFYVAKENPVPVPKKQVVEANDKIFAMSKFSEGKWTLDTPTSLYDWNYLVIGTENTAANTSHEIKITDKNGKTIRGNDYNGQAVGTGGGMWLDHWNSQNIIAIDLNQLRIANGLDIFNIVSLEITGDIKPSVVYLTDYSNPRLTNRSAWYTTGDVERKYTETGKFGTICLPYKASYAGAEIYSISGKDASGISLSKVTGLLEAGKPYFYMASDEIGQNNEGTVRNVNFFRADFDTYNVAPIENNGLIGTFSAITAPKGDNFYVLSNNKLYYTTDATVNVGANKAYINKSQIVNKGGGAAKAFIDFDELEATGIDAVDTAKTLKGGKFYDLSGREVANPTRGLYIVNGKKVLIK